MRHIAVVEDNPDNRLLVRAILERTFAVSEYECGAAALDGIRRARPDLLLLDISLPEMDGTEVLRRIRADAQLRSLPVVALTAHAMEGDRERFLDAGFDEHIPKPITDTQFLISTIERLLDDRASTSDTGAAP